jgi:hypothetical protein
MNLYISFHTSAEAMATEKVAMLNNITGKLIPLPRRISASCGIAFETDTSNRATMQKLLDDNKIEWDEFIEI